MASRRFIFATALAGAVLAGTAVVPPAFATTWTHTSSVDTDAGNRFLTLSSTGTAAVVSHDSDSVTLFSSSTGNWIATIAVGNGPSLASFTANGATLAVLNETDETVSVIDVGTHTVTITFEVESGAQTANISPDGKSVYSGNYFDRFLNVYSASTGVLTKQIDMGASDNYWMTFGNKGKIAYVSSQGGSQIGVVNVKKKRNVYDISLDHGTPGVTALSPNRRFLAVPIADEELGIKIVDVKKKRLVANILTPDHNPQSVAFTADSSTLYATDSRNGTIWTIDMATLSIVDTDVVWSAGLNGMILSPDNSFAYLSNSNVDSLWKVTIS